MVHSHGQIHSWSGVVQLNKILEVEGDMSVSISLFFFIIFDATHNEY